MTPFIFDGILSKLNPQNPSQSTDPVDIRHVQFWNECVDNGKPTFKSKLENSYTPT